MDVDFKLIREGREPKVEACEAADCVGVQARATKAALDAIYEAIDNPIRYEVVCAWCKRLKYKGKWIVAEPKQGCMITHGICPECLEDQLPK